MKISYSFYSLKDLSDLSNGERLLEILLSNGLVVEKAGPHEPIREAFITSKLPELWEGVGSEGELSQCYFLFKGKNEIKFLGMVTWNVNLHSNTKAFNGIDLWLTIQKKHDISRLVQLGDDIFEWSEAVYGYITEDSKDPSNDLVRSIQYGLPGLMWVNYFGPTYIEEPDFHIPNDHVPISHGVRINLSETPTDEKLSDPDFLQSIKNKIGAEWFHDLPRKYNKKVPFFDRTAITKR